VSLKVISIQTSERLGTINDAIKMQKVLFHRSYDIMNKLLIIIHADKISVKKYKIFSQTKPQAFSRALHFENHKSRRSPHDVPSPLSISSTQEQIISFPRKITRELQDFKSKLF
jgi:hypothetical protein